MDLFHAISQSIDKVLTCDWLEDFKSFKTPDTKNMNTEPGGEQTQYEGAVTTNLPPKKQSGQLGASSSSTQDPAAAASQQRGEKTADNIRYGQSISESGMGGMTNSSGSAEGAGHGGVAKDKASDEAGSAESRSSQGYGPGSGVGG